MEDLSSIKSRIEAAVPGAKAVLISDAGGTSQPSLWLDNEHARAIAEFLRDDPQLRFDYASNVTGIDWPERVTKETVKTKRLIDGVEREIQETVETRHSGFLEAVYHLYSMELKRGPLTLRLRTENRADNVRLPSLTPVWRAAEFQEREIYDLYGIVFDGHPDLRRILMWDGFKDHPMRKDYVEPDDYEYEPTAHDEVAARAKRHDRSEKP